MQIWKRELGFTPDVDAFHKSMSAEDRLILSLNAIFEHKRRLLAGEIPMDAFDPDETFRIEAHMLRERMGSAIRDGRFVPDPPAIP